MLAARHCGPVHSWSPYDESLFGLLNAFAYGQRRIPEIDVSPFQGGDLSASEAAERRQQHRHEHSRGSKMRQQCRSAIEVEYVERFLLYLRRLNLIDWVSCD